MSAVLALKLAQAAGVRIGIDGDALTLTAKAAPPADLLELLARHKAGIVTLLRPANDGWSGEDWLAFFDEWAGIASSTAACHDKKLRHAPSTAVSSNGSTAIRRARHLAAAWAAGEAETLATCFYRSAPNRQDMLGCIRAVGRRGTPDAKPRQSPH